MSVRYDELRIFLRFSMIELIVLPHIYKRAFTGTYTHHSCYGEPSLTVWTVRS